MKNKVLNPLPGETFISPYGSKQPIHLMKPPEKPNVSSLALNQLSL